MSDDPRKSPRYPNTFACDLVRNQAIGEDKVGSIRVPVPKISRADASTIITLFSEVLGIPRAEVATRLANRYIAEGLS